MPEYTTEAHIVGKRYNCDECGEEMTHSRDPRGVSTTLLSDPPLYPSSCPNGHKKNLLRSYPGHDIIITNNPPRP